MRPSKGLFEARRNSDGNRSSGFVWTREGWLYLAVILDLFSRKVVGWATSNRIDRYLVLRALTMALDSRSPQENLLYHSDRGSQYASRDYRCELEDRGIVCSMSRKGDCWDNAVVEAFFASLKKELIFGSVPNPVENKNGVISA